MEQPGDREYVNGAVALSFYWHSQDGHGTTDLASFDERLCLERQRATVGRNSVGNLTVNLYGWMGAPKLRAAGEARSPTSEATGNSYVKRSGSPIGTAPMSCALSVERRMCMKHGYGTRWGLTRPGVTRSGVARPIWRTCLSTSCLFRASSCLGTASSGYDWRM